MKIVSQTTESYLCDIPTVEYSLLIFLLRSLHEHMQYDKECDWWTDDGRFFVAMENEVKQNFDSIISNI